VDGAAAALAHLKSAAPSLILLDAMMPDVDGYDLSAQINALALQPEPIVIMLSSGGMPGEPDRCRGLGINAYLTKPIGPQELRAAIVEAAETRNIGQSRLITRDSLAQADARPLRVLLAEDNSVNVRLALALLDKWGHRVVTVSDGRKAVDTALAGEFDVILMDVQMPEMNGLDATRLIRQHEQGSGHHVRIIAMTANAIKGDRERCLEAGMDDYISKPIRSESLHRALLALAHEPVAALAEPEVPADAGSGFDYMAAFGRTDQWMLDIISEPFREDWPRQMESLKLALASDDRANWRMAAHTLKGLLGQFCADPAEALARRLETMSLTDTPALAQPEVAALELELVALDKALVERKSGTPT